MVTVMLLYVSCWTDLTGSQDGSVRLWEWSQQHCIAVARQPGSFPKVAKVAFSAQGNKVGLLMQSFINVLLYHIRGHLKTKLGFIGGEGTGEWG